LGRAPGSVSQRNGGVGELSFALTSRLAFEDPPAFPSADVLEAGNHKKPIPAIDRPQQSFRRLLSNLTPPGTPTQAERALPPGDPSLGASLLLSYLRAHARRWRCRAKVSA
jgi:hypothetical protein